MSDQPVPEPTPATVPNAAQDRIPTTAALTTNAPCAVLLTPPVTTGGRLRLASLTVRLGNDEMWRRLIGGRTVTDTAAGCCCDVDPPGLRCIPCLTGRHGRCVTHDE